MNVGLFVAAVVCAVAAGTAIGFVFKGACKDWLEAGFALMIAVKYGLAFAPGGGLGVPAVAIVAGFSIGAAVVAGGALGVWLRNRRRKA